jgi:hypothetical protein
MDWRDYLCIISYYMIRLKDSFYDGFDEVYAK